MGSRWETPYLESRVAEMIEKVQKTGKARIIWKKVEKRMRERGIPFRGQLNCRVSDNVPTQTVHRALREEVKQRQLAPEFSRWILQGPKVVSEPKKTSLISATLGRL